MYLIEGPGDGRLMGFILPPKTGSRSIEAALTEQLNARRVGGRHTVPKILPKVDVMVASIRNPYEVIVSWCGVALAEGKPIDGFLRSVLEGKHPYMQESALPGADKAEQYIRYEFGIADQLNRLLNENGWPSVDVPHIGKTAHKGYRLYYTPEQRLAVREKFAADFDRFHYHF